MKVLFARLVFMAGLLPAVAFADVTLDWLEPTRGVSIAVDAFDNVFTVDYEYNPAGDITLTKRSASGALLWEARYDQTQSSLWEKAIWVATDTEGNAIVAGDLMSGYSNPVNAASIVMKFAPDGQLLWRQVYETGFDGSFTKRCLIDESNNIYVLGMGSGQPGFVTKVKKFAPDGTQLWSYFDAAGIGAPVFFKFTPDGGIVISARSIFGSVNGYAKIDREGNVLWSHPGVYSLTVGDVAGDGMGNSYVVHGEYVNNGGTVIRKLSTNGTLLWSEVYALSAFRVEVGSDDQPVAVGFPNANTPGAAFLKADADGAVVWANLEADGPLGLLLHAQLLMDTNDNIYLAAGTLFDMAVCKVGSDGASAWTMTMPGSYANGIALGVNDDVYVVGGRTAKLEQAPAADTPDPSAALAFGTALAPSFPNPTSGNATLRFRLPRETRATLTLYDPAGRAVQSLTDGVRDAGWNEVVFESREFSGGVYIYELQYDGIVERRTMTIVH